MLLLWFLTRESYSQTWLNEPGAVVYVLTLFLEPYLLGLRCQWEKHHARESTPKEVILNELLFRKKVVFINDL